MSSSGDHDPTNVWLKNDSKIWNILHDSGLETFQRIKKYEY